MLSETKEKCHKTGTPFFLLSVLPTAPRVILKNNRHSRRSLLCLTLLKAFRDLYNKSYSLSQAQKALHNLVSVNFFISVNSCILSHTQSLGPSLVLHLQYLYLQYTLWHMSSAPCSSPGGIIMVVYVLYHNSLLRENFNCQIEARPLPPSIPCLSLS